MNNRKHPDYIMYNDHTSGTIEHEIIINKFFSCFLCIQKSDFKNPGERHDFWELVVITEGTADIMAESTSNKLHAGMGILHPPMEFHNIAADMPDSNDLLKFIIISFDAPEMEIPDNRLFNITPFITGILLNIVNDIKKTFACNTPQSEYSGFLLQGLLEDPEISPQYFAAAVEMVLSMLINPRQIKKQRLKTSEKYYNKLLYTVHANIHQCLSVSQIAEMCGISPDYAKKLFKRINGEPIIGYYNRIKMDSAKKFMKQGMTVGETARRLGYTDQNYFSRVFRRYENMTPSDYRRTALEHNHYTEDKQHFE